MTSEELTQWDELKAQIESHDDLIVEFYLDTAVNQPGKLELLDVKFEDSRIKVTFG